MPKDPKKPSKEQQAKDKAEKKKLETKKKEEKQKKQAKEKEERERLKAKKKEEKELKAKEKEEKQKQQLAKEKEEEQKKTQRNVSKKKNPKKKTAPKAWQELKENVKDLKEGAKHVFKEKAEKVVETVVDKVAELPVSKIKADIDAELKVRGANLGKIFKGSNYEGVNHKLIKVLEIAARLGLEDKKDRKIFDDVDGIFHDILRIENRFTDPQKNIKSFNQFLDVASKKDDLSLQDLEKIDMVRQTERDLLKIEKRIESLMGNLEEEERTDDLKKTVSDLKDSVKSARDKIEQELTDFATRTKSKIDDFRVRQGFRDNLIAFEIYVDGFIQDNKDNPKLNETDIINFKTLMSFRDRAHEILERKGHLSGRLYRDQIQDASQLYADFLSWKDQLSISWQNNVANPLLPCEVEFRELYYDPRAQAIRDSVQSPSTIQKEHILDEEQVRKKQKGENVFARAKALGKKILQGKQEKEREKEVNESLIPQATIIYHVKHWVKEFKDEKQPYNEFFEKKPSALSTEKAKIDYLVKLLSAFADSKKNATDDNKKQSITELEDKIWGVINQNQWDKTSGVLYLMKEARTYESANNPETAARLRTAAKNLSNELTDASYAKQEQPFLDPAKLSETKSDGFRHKKSYWNHGFHKTKARFADVLPDQVARHVGLETLSHVKQAVKLEQEAGRVAKPQPQAARKLQKV